MGEREIGEVAGILLSRVDEMRQAARDIVGDLESASVSISGLARAAGSRGHVELAGVADRIAGRLLSLARVAAGHQSGLDEIAGEIAGLVNDWREAGEGGALVEMGALASEIAGTRAALDDAAGDLGDALATGAGLAAGMVREVAVALEGDNRGDAMRAAVAVEDAGRRDLARWQDVVRRVRLE